MTQWRGRTLVYHGTERGAKWGSWSRRSAQEAAKGGDDGGLRLSYGRNSLVVLPGAAQTFIQAYELLGLRHLCHSVLFLQVVKLTLGVDHVEKVGQTPVVALGREIHRPLTRQ